MQARLLALITVALVSALGCGKSDPNAPPRGFDKVDHDIRIGVLPGRLRYDVEEFIVRPGSRVKLTFANNDSMQHNLLICKAGKGVLERVSNAVLKLGDRASEKDFVPRSRSILWHTKALLPGEEHVLWIKAPKKRDRYPYICTLPGHTYTMRGAMVVGDVPEPLLTDVRYEMFEGKFSKLAQLEGKTPTKTGELKKGVLDLAELGKRSNYGVWFHAKINAAKAGKYTFFLRSDDGSRVRVNGEELVAHDGTHPVGPWRKGSVELEKGTHDVRVEFFQGGGGQALYVDVKGPGLKRTKLTGDPKKGPPKGVPIMVMHEPVVMRVHVEGSTARSVAMGFPDGMNCVFDASTCRMKFGWAGAFLDVGPDRLGRGGRPCRILGKRFEVGDTGFPLRRAGAQTDAAKFEGYRTGKATSLLVDWAGQDVVWTVSKAREGVGLRYDFELPGIDTDVQFAIDRKGLDVVESAGTWSDDLLTVPLAAASRFTVTLRPTALNAAATVGESK